MSKSFKVVSIFSLLAIIVGLMHFSSVGGEEIKAAALSVDERLENAIALYVGSSQAFVKNVEKQVDPENPDIKPIVKNGRTLVPVRFISESLGAKVEWDADTATVTVSYEDKVISLVVGKKNMKVGNKSVELDVAAEINEGRTYLPLRALVEALEKKVFYDRGLIIIGQKEDVFDIGSEKSLIDEVISKVNNLPVVGSYDELIKLFEKNGVYSGSWGGELPEILRGSVTLSMNEKSKKSESESIANTVSADDSSGAGSSDYSKTNVQVQGVDEADVVKTDGKYIYHVNKDRIAVVKAYDSVAQNTYSDGGMKILSMLDYSKDSFNPQELYIDGNTLVAIGSYYEDNIVTAPKQKERARILPYYRAKVTTKAIICDISDRKNIKKTREVEIEGYYVSSRKIDSTVYIISNKDSNIYYTDQEVHYEAPNYKDTIVSGEYIEIGYPDIRYFPDSVETNYLTVAAVDIKSDRKANIQTFLGAGQNVYASSENLYVSVTNYRHGIVLPKMGIRGNSSTMVDTGVGIDTAVSNIEPSQITDSQLTSIYKFSLDGTKVTYLNKGEVPGSILNQFSMDENGGYFRIATTTSGSWSRGSNASSNNLYILDETMSLRGKIENIAPGESIYSVRFMGDRGYIVTFKKVDPLFVIDLKDPANPKILGKLKIPGFSDYLHPYDENHIIGFGKDTEEIYDNAYEQGMKIALFDVTDVNNPVQKFSEIIGDRGTDSELLRNHKALLFSKEKNLLAFPVMLMEVKEDAVKNGRREVFNYGEFAYQGAYIYNIDLQKGFSLRGRITHISDEDYLKSGQNYYYPNNYVERILYIGDTLYTLSKGVYKAHGLNDLKERDSLVIPE